MKTASITRQLSNWRRAYDEGGIDALKPKTRGRKHLSQDEIERREQANKLAALEKKNAELERKLAQAEAIIEVQKKTGGAGGHARDLRGLEVGLVNHLHHIHQVPIS